MKEFELKSNYLPELSDEDYDICDSNELNIMFRNCEEIAEASVVHNTNYILHLSATRRNIPTIAVGLSDHVCEIYILHNHLIKMATISEHTDKLVNVKFSPINEDLLYTASNDGTIKLFDLRVPPKSVIQFIDTTTETEMQKKVFSCFDISPNDRLLTAGTDLFQGDAFLLFWDLRKTVLLGAYWESHTDDITQVKFHNHDVNKLISSSTDGLINVYDLTQSSEDDAILETFNTENSVETLDWFQNDISCITHTGDLQFWKLEGVEPYHNFKRAQISGEMKRANSEFTYIVNVHETNTCKFVLCGSNYHDGECLRGLKIDNLLKSSLNFSQNKQRVRSSWFNNNINLLITGGEKGLLNIWNVKLD